MHFKNRIDAGKQLAQSLTQYDQAKDTVVLALPRGGIILGYEIAKVLTLPLDVFLVRKLGVPGHEELAFGAISENNTVVFNDDVLRYCHVSEASQHSVIDAQKQILQDRQQRYRGANPAIDCNHKNVILVDDGIATGATMKAAIQGLQRGSQPQKIIVAIPVAPTSTYREIKPLVADVICLDISDHLMSVGQFYSEFEQVSDETVTDLLLKARIDYSAHYPKP